MAGPARQPRRPPAGGRPSPVILGLVYGGIGLLALAVFAITFLVISPPTDLIRREIAAQVKAATGRDLTIAGEASFTFFPSLGVRVGQVSLSAPPGMGGDPFLSAASFDVGVRLLPLLQQEIVVDRLVLNEPVFALRVDREGRRSWDMASGTAARPVQLAQAGGDTLTDVPARDSMDGQMRAAARLSEIAELSLGDIRIINGTVRYSDERDASAYEVAAISARVELASLARPLDAKGSFVWSQEKIDFDGKLTSAADFLQQRPAKLALSITGAPVTLSYDGSLTLVADALSAEGAVNGSAASLRALAHWLGTELPPARGYREVSFAGRLNAAREALRLSDAKLSLDGATATGTIAVATSGARPHVVADLKVSRLNLDNYLGGGAALSPTPAGEPREPAQAAPPAAAPAPSEAPSGPKSIEDLLERPGPQVKGFTQRAGWSGEPLDLALLGLVDADARLSVASLNYGDLRADSSQVLVALKDRVLKTTFEDVKLYQGKGKGSITLDGTGAEAAVKADFALSGIAAQPLLKDLARIDWLAGTANVTLALAGRGGSEAAIVQSLSGKSDIAVSDGAIIGFNLGGAMRALSEGNVPTFESSPSEKTDFSELTGSFLITDGIAKNDDLKLLSPLLRAGGAGTVNLPERSLDYTLRPKLVASIAGQGGKQDLAGLEIPVHVSGPWGEPNIAPDIEGAINNPDTMEAVKEIGKQFKGKNAGEIIEDLFGKGEEGEPSKAEKLLQKFLGR
jgi:AsmA protein